MSHLHTFQTELHLHEWQQRELEYLQAYSRMAKPHMFEKNPTRLQEFRLAADGGYGENSITDDFVTDVYLEFDRRTRAEESADYLRTLSGSSHTVFQLAERQRS